MRFVATTLFNVSRMFAAFGLAVVAGLTLIGFAQGWALAEQATSLRPYLVLAAVVGLIWLAICHAVDRLPRVANGAPGLRGWSVLAALVVVVNIAVVTTTSDARATACAEPALRLLVVNQYFRNPTPQAVSALIDEHRPDILVISELTEPVASLLRDEFAHRYGKMEGGTSGIAVFSAHPLSDTEAFHSRSHGPPALSALVQTPAGAVRVIALHPFPPSTQRMLTDRNEIIELATQRASVSEVPVILAGDFNTTPWSPTLRALGLLAQRADTPGTFPAGAPLKIPIDHAFVRGFDVCASRGLPANIGSDHDPILVDLVPTSSAPRPEGYALRPQAVPEAPTPNLAGEGPGGIGR